MPSHRRHHIQTLDELGQTLSEYSILVGAIAIVVAVALPLLGASVKGLFSGAVQALGG